MSSVYGVVRIDGHAVPVAEVAALETVLASRSSDGFKRLQHGGALFGNGLLCTRRDKSGQHHLLETEQHLLTADLRLENQQLVKRQLGLAQDLDDATLVLEAYRRWGADCPRHLRGDFAFAVWNKQARQLFCCRDHLAARPFYYALTREFLAFASEPEALIQLDGVSAAPNEERIASLLVADYEVRELDRTWNRDVFAVMGGERLEWQPSGQPRKQRYWSLTQPEILRLPRFSDYVEAFHERFERALRSRSDGDTCALLLSGGMDSAAIAAAMQRNQMTAVDSYSVVDSGDGNCIESNSIRRLQALPCLQHASNSVDLAALDQYMELLEKLAFDNPHPVDNAILALALLARLAGGSHRVLLHGAAGDVVQVPSLNLPTWFLQQGRPYRAWLECQQMSRNHTYFAGESALRRYIASLSSVLLPTALKRSVRGVFSSNSAGIEAPDLHGLSPDFVARFDLEEKLRLQAERQRRVQRPLEWIDTERMMTELQSSNTGSDRIAGRAGMVGRDVWADLDLVEFYCQLPLDVRTGDGWTKYLARHACAETLPPQVVWRNDKTHLGWRLVQALLSKHRAVVNERLVDCRDSLQRFVSQREIDRVQGLAVISADDQDQVFQLLSLGGWLEQAGF